MNIATATVTAPSSRCPSPNLPLVAEHVFETTSSETRYTGRIFALRTDHVRMPGGNIATREVVEHYGAVAVVAMDDDGNIPMVYQYRHPFGRRLWELPAGLLDVDGEAPHLTAARELREEAGLQAQTWQVLVDLNSTPGFSDESVRVYLATGLTHVDQPEAHDEEADMTVQWYSIAEATRRVLAGDIVNAIASSGILAAYAIRKGFGQPRPVDAPWIDRPTAFSARQAAR
jgi:8-oxo-dGDP phosphatase